MSLTNAQLTILSLRVNELTLSNDQAALRAIINISELDLIAELESHRERFKGYKNADVTAAQAGILIANQALIDAEAMASLLDEP